MQKKEKYDKHDSPIPNRANTFMSAEDLAAGKKSVWYELEINGVVRNLSPDLFKLNHLTSLYLNGNSLSRIPCEVNKLVHLAYLDLSHNKLRSLPSELGDLTQLRELLLDYNALRVLPYELGKLFNLQNLGLSYNPLSPEIMSIFNSSNGTQKLLSYMLDNLAVSNTSYTDTQSQELDVNSTAPPERQWMFLSPPDKTKATATFTVMCYNVLCDKYCTRQLYGYCPSWALNWDFRKKGIMDEIKHYMADIICLQEVETDQFYNFFLPDLKAIGYDGIFSAKSRARTMTESERKHVDGCAIFYRTNKFTLIKEHLIEFNKLAMANAEGSDDMLNRVMTKDNIGMAALLETKEGAYENVPPQESQVRQPVMISTAHIHWDPEFSDVKLIQTMMLVNELKKITEETIQSYKLGTSDVNTIPLIMCGDLNSLPDSGVVEYLVSGKVASNHEDFKEISYEEILHRICVKNEKEILSHDFRLSKAYDDIMPFTNYTYDFKGVIDYVFYSREHFNLLGLLGPLDEGWFRQNKVVGCPHPHIPSDHFSLLVDFEMSLPFPSGRTANGPVSHR
ncbi:CCR4-NOT transcription complex subunit 6-like isoform X2 [Mytilus californianus]|uniref:CCR4-NOT transcription complex subunit 6-like isoform X2 n=1 Tax=Mytilus californianus TaxID=6549 RepID=UPI002247AAA6|nr:CCR4-NOT transcription complex subunit 6-like isoform X2 [Mytilus californianus]XP_052071499.1 CCR4-NOT transcription complex subunit 6-like isoform X2 [Mytilus californianus]